MSNLHNSYYVITFVHRLTFIKFIVMIKIQVKFVAYGDYVHLKDDENSPLWIRHHYDRSSKTYCLTSYDNVGREIFRKASSFVYLDV